VANSPIPVSPTLEPRRRPGWPPHSPAIPAAGSGWTAATPPRPAPRAGRGDAGLPHLPAIGGWRTGPPPGPGRVGRAPLQRPACRRSPRRRHGTPAGRRGRDRDGPQHRSCRCRTTGGGAGGQRRTEAPLELTIDAHDDVVRVEVHDQAPRVALGLEEHPGGHGGALAPAATDSLDRWGAVPPGERDQVLWAELRSGDDGGLTRLSVPV
jgi:hypothetical protein